MKIDLSAIVTALQAAVPYIPVTLRLALLPLLFGSLLGLGIALIRYYRLPLLARFLSGLITIGKGIPIVLSLIVVYLLFSDAFDQLAATFGWSWQFKDLNREYIAIFVLSLYASISLSEVFRGALSAIAKDQLDAAAAIGLTTWQTIYRVLLPQLVPVAPPLLCSQLIVLIKASALVSMVSVVDVLNGALITAATNYTFLEAYLAAALIYWGLALLIEQLSGQFERYYAKKFARGRLV